MDKTYQAHISTINWAQAALWSLTQDSYIENGLRVVMGPGQIFLTQVGLGHFFTWVRSVSHSGKFPQIFQFFSLPFKNNLMGLAQKNLGQSRMGPLFQRKISHYSSQASKLREPFRWRTKGHQNNWLWSYDLKKLP